MKVRHQFLVGLVLTLMLVTTSCSVQKRRYRKGFYVSWNRNYSNMNKKETSTLNVSSGKNQIIDKIKFKPLNKVTVKTEQKSDKIIKLKTEQKPLKTKKFKNQTATKKTSKEFSQVSFLKPIPTDSTDTKPNNIKVESEKIKNEKLSTAKILILIGIWLFMFGGFIAIIVGYFYAIRALIEIRNNTEIYKDNEARKAKIIIYAFNIFFLIAFIILLILTFIDSLILILTLIAAFYLLMGIIGLSALKTSKIKLAEEQSKNNSNEKGAKDKRNKTKRTALVLFLITALFIIGYPFYSKLF